MDDPRDGAGSDGVFIHQRPQPLADGAPVVVGRRQQLHGSKRAVVPRHDQIGERASDVDTDPVFDYSRHPICHS